MNLSFEEVWKDLVEVLSGETVIYTLGRKCRNEIDKIDSDGIWVITEKSAPKSELVPKWMFEKALMYLGEHGEVTHDILTGKLRVMRSAFVMAALSKLKYMGHETRKGRVFLKIRNSLET